jgi:hypothetical protein
MTKETYLEMCETLGNTPLPEEIPLELEDLFIEVQYAFSIYSELRDDWDTMNGDFLGKHLEGILDIFIINDVPAEDRKVLLSIINIIDKCRVKISRENKPKN